MGDREAFHPVAGRTLALVLAGLVTALPPLWLAGSRASALGHALLGAALIGVGLWRVWRPLVARFGRRGALRVALMDVAEVLPVPRTGHAPSERDLAAWVGLRTRSGETRWLDLGELRPRVRHRVRSLLEAAARR